MTAPDRRMQSIAKKPPNAPLAYLILQYISTRGYSVTAREIASVHDLNPGSVRACLSKMYSKGLISRPSHGKYECVPGYPLGSHRGGLRAQNLQVAAEGVPVREHEVVRIEFSGYVSLTVTFGKKRGRITYLVGVPLGLCPVGMVLVHGIVTREVKARGYLVPSEAWVVKRVEILEDFRGFKLDGMQSVTFENCLGELVKYYNRAGLRRESKSGRMGIQLRQFRALLDEGVDSSLLHRRMDQIEREMRNVLEATKGSNRIAVKTNQLNQALLDAYLRRENGRR